MASLAETQRLFLDTLPEAEEAPSPRDGLSPSGRQLGGRHEQRRMVLAAGFAFIAVACIGLAVWPRAPAPAAARVTAAQGKAEDLIEPFQQCGGEGWTNGTCCTKGCACVAETRYYSQCKTPEGLQECDWDRAKTEKEAAKARVEDRKTDLEEREEAVKMASHHLNSAQKIREHAEEEEKKASKIAEIKNRHLKAEEASAGRELKKVQDEANEELDKIVKETKATLAEKTQDATELRDGKLKAARDARAAAEKEKKARRAVFDDANKVYAAKVKERLQVKAHVDKYEAAEKIRKTKKCGGLFNDCTASNCCVVGCEPHWQNKYFCQCEGPGGAKYCAAKEQIDLYTKSTKAMPTLTEDRDKLDKANETAASKSKEADEHYARVADKAERDIDAAREEFKTSTKVPADAADKKIHAAKMKAEKKISEAKETYRKKTAKARSIANKADEAKHAAAKVAKAKRDAESSAAADATAAAKTVTQAKMALASAKAAVGSWTRAASGNFCGKDGDGLQLGF